MMDLAFALARTTKLYIGRHAGRDACHLLDGMTVEMFEEEEIDTITLRGHPRQETAYCGG